MSMDWRIFVAPGSALFVLPLAAVLGLLLAWREPAARGAVLRWWAALAAGAALVAASKIAFYGWGTGVRAWDLTCFSGHTVLGLGFWPVALAVAVPPRWHGGRRLAAALGWLAGGLVGFSRIPLGAHPLSEVLAGAVLGLAVGAYGLHVLRAWRWPPWTTATVGLACVLVALWLARHAAPTLPSERWFAALGSHLAGREAPVPRRGWKE